MESYVSHPLTPFNGQILLKALALETFAMTLLGEQVGVGDIIEKNYR